MRILAIPIIKHGNKVNSKREIFQCHFLHLNSLSLRRQTFENSPHYSENSLPKKKLQLGENYESYPKILQSVPIILKHTLVQITWTHLSLWWNDLQCDEKFIGNGLNQHSIITNGVSRLPKQIMENNTRLHLSRSYFWGKVGITGMWTIFGIRIARSHLFCTCIHFWYSKFAYSGAAHFHSVSSQERSV